MRRRLSIIACPAYAPHDPTPRRNDDCERCGRRVHDLSSMTARQLHRLLDERPERICVHARVRPDGSPVLGRRRALGGLVTLGLTGLAACAPHVTALELPGSLCEDPDGFEVSCESELDRWLESIPDDETALEDEPVADREAPEPASRTTRDDDTADDDDVEVLDISDVEYLGMIEVDESLVAPPQAPRGDAGTAG